MRVLLFGLLTAACLVELGLAQTANSISPVDPREAFKQAFEHYKVKRYSDAEQLFTEGLRSNPSDAQAVYYLAESKLALGKRMEAKELFTRAARMGLPAQENSRASSMLAALKCGEDFHSVRAGESLRQVGVETAQDWRDIMRWSGLANSNVLEVGMCLRIRPP